MADHTHLTDMKQSKKAAKDSTAEVASDSPRYPYGLDLDLDTESLAKLGIKDLPKVGTAMKVTAIGVVTAARTNERVEGKQDRNITIQMQKLSVGPAKKPTAVDAVTEGIKDA